MEDDTRVEEEGGGGSLSLVVRPAPFLQPTRPSSQPAALLPANAALLHAVGPGAVPGVANSLLSLLQRWEERREQEERWCEGKSPGPADPTSSPLPGTRRQAAPMGPCQTQGQALPRPPSLCAGAHLAPSFLGWQVAWVARSTGEVQILRRAGLGLGKAGKLCKGDRNGR